MNKNSIVKYTIIFLMFYFVCCKTESNHNISFDSLTGNERMKHILDSVVKSVVPPNGTFDNSANAKYFYDRVQKTPTDFNLRLKYADELLLAGETEKSIAELDQLYQFLKSTGKMKPEYKEHMLKLLAIANLRLGEQENCLQHHSDQSCLIPIKGSGIHQLKNGSEIGTKYLKELLQDNPNDLISVWLLNIAAMTLGTYPESVPKEFLIPPSKFQNKMDFPKFQDIAMNNNTAINETSGGVAVEDFDQDGYLDIIATGWGLHESIRYLHNDGNGQFTDLSEKAQLKGIIGGLNVIQGDYNNDGWMDFMVLRGAWLINLNLPNSLFRNNGDGTFTDVTIEAGVLSFHPTQAGVFCDFNNDGFLDLFIGNESTKNPHPNELYLNDTKGKFINVLKGSGVEQLVFFCKGITAGDINNDGWTDVYLTRMGGNNMLLLNRSTEKKIQFEDVSQISRTANPQASFSTCMLDFNNDGNLDIFAGSFNINRYNHFPEDIVNDYRGKPFLNELCGLYINNGDVTFKDIAREAGLNTSLFIMALNKGDVNNDGFEDFYFGTGEPSYEAIIPNRMFINMNGERLEDVSYVGGFAHLQKGHGISFADFDQDGDQDIYAVMGGAYEGDRFFNAFFNNPGFGSHSIKIRLRGHQTNYFGAHSRIKVTIITNKGKRIIHRQMDSGGSFGSNPYLADIGLGKDAKLIESIEIYWPTSKLKKIYTGLDMDRGYILYEDQTESKPIELKPFKWNLSVTHCKLN